MIARTGYRSGGPEEYLKHLDEFVAAHQTIVRMRGEVAGVQGIDRAKLLDQLIEAYAKLGNEPEDVKTWTAEIIALDADNQAGLKIKYQYRQLVSEADALKRDRKFEAAKTAYDQALELPGISGEQKQDAYYSRGECFFHAQDFVGVVACLKQAAEAAPDSSKATAIQEMLQQFAPAAEAQEAVAKLKGQLETAQGLDRARVLDQLLDARTTLSRSVPDPELARDTDTWAREIVELDAQNEAGLTSKYGVRVLLADARQLLRDQKLDEAHAALDKALAIPGVAGEPLLELHLAKAKCYAAQEEFENSIDACQKAIEAAPASGRAQSVRSQMQAAQAELDKRKAKEQAPAEAPKPTEPN
jgi:tetratricopeptide (TPR) repeat protein